MASRDRDVGRKYESGSTKRKKVEKRKDEERKLSGSLVKYFTSSVNKQLELCSDTVIEQEQPSSSTSHSPIKNDFTPSKLPSEVSSEDIPLDIIMGFTEEVGMPSRQHD